MAVIDVDGLIAEISPDNPCGDDLEYDPEFQELERASQGREAQQMGDSVIEAEGPDWSAVKKLCISILGRSKDMRASAYLVRALIHTDGFPGLRDSLQLLRGLLTTHWDSIHPQLDPDDGNDPTFRMNTLTSLVDPETMIRSIRDATLVSSRAMGTFALKHIQMARGEVAVPEGEDPPQGAVIDGAFQDVDLDELTATAEAAAESVDLMAQVEQYVTEQVGAAQAVDLSSFGGAIRAVQKELSDQLGRRGVAAPGAEVAEEEAAAAAAEAPVEAGAVAGGGAPPAAQEITGVIQSREDAIRMLDKLVEYFDKYEPSSPIPLLLLRAKRLVSKSFMEIMQDLAPDGVAQAQVVGGVDASAATGGDAAGSDDSGW
ncbi:MAG: type VI secretion system protein TssA [Planctomycetota bacterium]